MQKMFSVKYDINLFVNGELATEFMCLICREVPLYPLPIITNCNPKDKIPAFPEAGKMIVTENIHPPFPGILGKPGSRKLEIGPPVSWESWDYLESWEESTKISQENWDYSGSLEKFTIYSWESLEKPTPITWECQNLSETVDKLNGHIYVETLVPRS